MGLSPSVAPPESIGKSHHHPCECGRLSVVCLDVSDESADSDQLAKDFKNLRAGCASTACVACLAVGEHCHAHDGLPGRRGP